MGRQDSTPPASIAVLLPNWVGDAVMATPALRALRRRFDSAHIALIGRPAPLAALAGAGLGDDELPDTSARRPMIVHLLRMARRLRERRLDLAVLLPNSFRSAMLAWLGRARRRLGYAREGRGWMLTDRLTPPRDARGKWLVQPAMDYYIDLLTPLGISVEDRRMMLATTPEGESAAEVMLARAGYDEARPLVMLNPGASFGPSKRWLAGRYAAVADALAGRHGAQVIVNAAPNERAVAREVAEAMATAPLINFAERDNTLALLKSLALRCDLVITNDTGARHVAAAMGAGVVTIFGSTDPGWTTIDYPRERIVRADVACSPCQKKRCPLLAGPTFHQCMKAIGVDEVLAAAEELLAELPRRCAGGAS